MNSINTLAQLATKLMSGGHTVPGNLTIQGATTLGSTLGVTGNTTVGGTLGVTGNTTLGGRLTITGKGVAQDTFESGGDLVGYSYVFAGSNNVRVRLGETWGTPGIYAMGTGTTENDKLTLMSSSGKVHVGSTLSGVKPHNLIVTGNLQILDPVIRRNQIAGYFKIRAYGYKVPLHYGFNMLFEQHERTEKLRNSHGFPDSQIHFYRATSMNGDNNNDWRPRHLVVFPGYKIRIYFWRSHGFETSTASYPPGEHIFADNAFTEVAHGLQVRFEEESGEPPNRYQM